MYMYIYISKCYLRKTIGYCLYQFIYIYVYIHINNFNVFECCENRKSHIFFIQIYIGTVFLRQCLCVKNFLCATDKMCKKVKKYQKSAIIKLYCTAQSYDIKENEAS